MKQMKRRRISVRDHEDQKCQKLEMVSTHAKTPFITDAEIADKIRSLNVKQKH